MNKKEFFSKISDELQAAMGGSAVFNSEMFLNCVIKTIQDELNTDAAKCKVPGLGTFKMVLVKERTYQNPRSEGSTTVPEHYAIKFKAAKEL